MSRIQHVFQRLKARREGGLIGFTVAGDPSLTESIRIADALVEGGVDILELGIPFSDPIADGRTIQASTTRALKAGTTPYDALKVAQHVAQVHGIPVVILTYFNPVFRMGVESFFQRARDFGVDGVIVPDLPVTEADEHIEVARRHGIDTIFLATPTTPPHRLQKIIDSTSGFLYLVSLLGVTGARNELRSRTLSVVRDVSRIVDGRLPVAVGFGVSKPEQIVSILKAGADGVIVGSALIQVIEEHMDDIESIIIHLKRLTQILKDAAKGVQP